MLCTKCHSDSPAGDDRCRSCGNDIPVDAEVKRQRELERRAAEIAELKAKVAAKKERDEREANYAEAMRMSEAELEELRVAAGETPAASA